MVFFEYCRKRLRRASELMELEEIEAFGIDGG